MSDAKRPKTPNMAELGRNLGRFHGVWSVTDRVTDYAIKQFLNITAEQAHLVTAGMMFGRKARLLADLVGRSNHPNKAQILGAINWIRGNAMRDVIAHSYHKLDDKTFGFVSRSASGEFRAVEYVFTHEEFYQHAKTLLAKTEELQVALGATNDDLRNFANAAFNLNRKSRKSPVAPDESA